MLAVGPDELLSKVTAYLEETVQVCKVSVPASNNPFPPFKGRHIDVALIWLCMMGEGKLCC
jgi:hypothetical protein